MAITAKEKQLRKKWQGRGDSISSLPSKPRSGVVRFDLSKPYPNSPFADLLKAQGGIVEPPDPDRIQCSYCGNDVDDSRATRGVQARMVKIETLHEVDGEIVVEVKQVHKQIKVIACPACCLQIKPSVERLRCPACQGEGKGHMRGQTSIIKCPKCAGSGKVDGKVTSQTRQVSREEC